MATQPTSTLTLFMPGASTHTSDIEVILTPLDGSQGFTVCNNFLPSDVSSIQHPFSGKLGYIIRTTDANGDLWHSPLFHVDCYDGENTTINAGRPSFNDFPWS